MSLQITPETCKDPELLAYAQYQEQLLEKHTAKLKELEKEFLANKLKENQIKMANHKIATEYDTQVRILNEKNDESLRLHAEYNKLIQDQNSSLEKIGQDLYEKFIEEFNSKNKELNELMAEIDAIQANMKTMATSIEDKRIKVQADVDYLTASEEYIVEAAKQIEDERSKLENLEVEIRGLYQTLAVHTEYHAKLMKINAEQEQGYELVRNAFEAGLKDRGFMYHQRNLLMAARAFQERGLRIYKQLTERYTRLLNALPAQ
ncbi:Hypothetical protein GSB_15603 [Giardia duodenalis]|uniref:Uncharacterized protein n=2 Tax=Giardia intestinalis TaxID=5741 RepID=C6LXA6_GIAIB|nr:Hypothetical protein GL50581_3422 [Giardia intestinalis ATCC 50581]ESU44895.1 Hypothetical protein GSB_15603 [Giardia intestinalis]